MFEQKVRVGMGHIGPDNLLKLGPAVDFLQNASWFQMDTEAAILDYFVQHGLNMYLVSRQVEISRLPAYGEELTLKAWIYGCDRRFGLRNTVMYDSSGELCMATSATGAFINLQSGHGAKISEEAVGLLNSKPMFPMDVQPRKIAIPSVEPRVFAPLEVLSYHLDSFQHMNNARYVDMASSCLPEGFAPRRMRMEYKRPATLGQNVVPHLYKDSSERLVLTLNGPDGICCSLEFLA